MPDVNSLDVLRVTARMNYGGLGAIENVYAFRATLIGSQPDGLVGVQVAELLEAAYNEIKGNMSGDVTFEDIRIFNVTQNRDMRVFAWPTLTAGTGSGDSLPPGVALLVKFGTGFIRELGRKFLGGYTEAVAAGGGWTNPTLAAALAFAGFLIDQTSMSDPDMAFHGGLINKDGIFHEFISAVVSGVAAYQRRRRQGRGI